VCGVQKSSDGYFVHIFLGLITGGGPILRCFLASRVGVNIFSLGKNHGGEFDSSFVFETGMGVERSRFKRHR